MIKRLSISLCLLIGLLIAMPSMSVLAIDDPDSTPEIDEVVVFEDLLETGDIGVLCNYYIDYTIAGTPDERVTESYLVIFIDTDGSTQLGAVAPYAYGDLKGYYRGAAWIYFSAEDVDTYSIDSANKDLYSVWLVGNPTIPSGWTGDPPKGTANIDLWHETGDPAVLLAQKVLDYASLFGYAWDVDLVETTSIGNRLTTYGEAYFTNVIYNLRSMAPACFSSSITEPALEDIDYSISFGGTVTSGTATVVGSPVTLDSGENTITTSDTGTITIDLNNGTYGDITDGTGTISSSPSNLVPGENEVTVTGAGTFTVDVELTSTQTSATNIVEGTGFDLTDVADRFGLSRLAFSGIVWFCVTIGLCAATYLGIRSRIDISTGRATNVTMLVFALSLLAGTLLGMLDTRVTALLAIGYGGFIGYILFFRTTADIGRTVMFMAWMWFVVCLVGGLLAGHVPQATTYLTSDVSDSATTINVANTDGFEESGMIIIGEERILYHKLTDTTFTGTYWRPLLRGQQDTDAEAHTAIDPDTGKYRIVRSIESALLNNTLNYNVALLADASGWMAFITLPLVLWDILTSFMFLPLSFLGTNLEILTYIWGIFGLGLIVSLFIALVGGRRV